MTVSRHQGIEASRHRGGKAGLFLLALSICLCVIGCGEQSKRNGEAGGGTDRPDSQAIDSALTAAEQYYHAQRLDEAEAILRRLIERAPDVAVAHELLGQSLYLRGILARQEGRADVAAPYIEEASRYYLRAAELDPDSAGLQHSAGMIALSAGRADDAIRLIARAMELDPHQPQYSLHLAQIHLQQERTIQAEELLRHVLTLDPDEPYAHASLAGIALERGDHDRAIEHIRQAREIDPSDLALRVEEAKIHRILGNPRRSVELLAPLPADQRMRRIVVEELARAYTETDHPERAVDLWKARYSERPEDWRAAIQAGRAYVLMNRLSEARSWLSIAELSAPDHPETKTFAEELSAAARRAAEGQQDPGKFE